MCKEKGLQGAIDVIGKKLSGTQGLSIEWIVIHGAVHALARLRGVDMAYSFFFILESMRTIVAKLQQKC